MDFESIVGKTIAQASLTGNGEGDDHVRVLQFVFDDDTFITFHTKEDVRATEVMELSS